MKQADIRPGLLLRVINSHGINAPLRSLATVETIERSNAGDWFCTIRYHGKRALVVLLFWLTITFTSFGLFAPRNVTVLAVLFVCALSVTSALFLVVEMDGPFDGLIKASADPLRYAHAHINQ